MPPPALKLAMLSDYSRSIMPLAKPVTLLLVIDYKFMPLKAEELFSHASSAKLSNPL